MCSIHSVYALLDLWGLWLGDGHILHACTVEEELGERLN